MKKTFKILFLFLLPSFAFAQQEEQFTQFTLDNYGLNPAVAGASNGLTFLAGNRTQWRGFDGGPKTQFANFTKAFGKKGYKKYWSGIGGYVQQDKFGVFTTKQAYLSYAIHIKMSSKFRASLGIAAGVKNVALSNIVFDSNDPVFAADNRKVTVPDIIPGIYVYSKKFSLSISVHNVYLNTLSFEHKELGSGTQLLPTAYITLTRKIISGDYNFVSIPAINLQSNFRGAIPSLNANFITYYKKRVGVGVNYRMHDAVSGILQVRIYKNIIVGFAYDFTISRFRDAKTNSDEVMMGLSPIMNTEDLEKQGNHDCPKFEL